MGRLRGRDAGEQLGERGRGGRELAQQRLCRGLLGVPQVGAGRGGSARHRRPGRGGGHGGRVLRRAGRVRLDQPCPQPGQVLAVLLEQRAEGARQGRHGRQDGVVPGDHERLPVDRIAHHGDVGLLPRRGAQRADAFAAGGHQRQRHHGGEHATPRRLPDHSPSSVLPPAAVPPAAVLTTPIPHRAVADGAGTQHATVLAVPGHRRQDRRCRADHGVSPPGAGRATRPRGPDTLERSRQQHRSGTRRRS